MKKDAKKDFAFICETQLHIFNAINFVENDIEESRGSAEIYIYNNFGGAEAIAARLKDAELFNEVYFINRYNEKVDAFTKLRNLYRLFFPKRTLISHIEEKSGFKKKNYKHLCMYSYTMRSRNFLRSFSGADIIMIEDGIGAYYANTMKDHIEGIYKLLDKYVFWGKYECNPDRLYVYRPELSDHEVTDNIFALPKIDAQNTAVGIAHKVFSYKENNQYSDKRYIYFTQPLELLQGGFIKDSEDSAYAVMEKLGLAKELIFRVHPRQQDAETYGCERDTAGNFWEIESLMSINENHVFVSAFSTAAFTPKYINDIEPYVIFTFKLNFREYDSVYWKKVEKFTERFATLYKDNNKVFMPASYEELENILKMISEKEI